MSVFAMGRTRRVGVAAGVFALAAVALGQAPAASATTTSKVAISTTVNGVLGGKATPGGATTVSFGVKNNSSSAKLAAFSIVVPKGPKLVKKGAASAPGGAWSETVIPCGSTANCSAILLVTANFPLTRTVAGPGQTVTASITFTAPTTPGTLTFPFLGIGGGLFTVAGPLPTVVVAQNPTALRIISVVDSSLTPPAPTPVANRQFTVTFAAVDSDGNIVPVAGITATLSSSNAVGTFTPSTPTGVTGADGRGTVVVTYSQPQQALQLGVAAPSLTAAGTTTNVGDSSGGGSDPITLSAGSAGASLPNGSVGPVTLTVTPCVATEAAPCNGPSEVTLAGKFTTPEGTELYSNDHPAKLTWKCSSDPEAADSCPAEYYDGPQKVGDFYQNPVDVALQDGVGGYLPFGTAGPCRDIYDYYDTGVGKIVTPDAQEAGYCVDVNAITRTPDCWIDDTLVYGTLTIPVLFVEDPKMRPTGG